MLESQYIEVVNRHLGFDRRKLGFGVGEITHNGVAWRYVHRRASEKDIASHYRGEKVIGLNHFPGIPILKVDLDNHTPGAKPKEALRDLSGVWGPPIFVERSDVSGGYHAVYRFDKPWNDFAVKDLEKELQASYPDTVEFRVGNQQIRLPMSVHYSDYGFYNPGRETLIETVPAELIWEHLTGNYAVPLPKELSRAFGISLQPVSVKKRSPSTADKMERYRYGRGTRYDAQKRIAFACAGRGESYETFLYWIEELHDGTSREMNQWSPERKEAHLRSLYEYAVGKATDIPWSFESDDRPQGHIVPTEMYLSLSQIAGLRELVTEKYPGKNGQGKRGQKWADAAIGLVNYLVWKKRYRDEKEYRYTYRKAKPLEEGVPFGLEECEAAGKALNLSNWQRVRVWLIEVGVLEEVLNAQGYAWSYKGLRHVKHYRLNIPETGVDN